MGHVKAGLCGPAESRQDALDDSLELAAFPSALAEDLYNEHQFRVLARDFAKGSVVGFDGPKRDVPVALGLGVRARSTSPVVRRWAT